jgi:hypothetical protein
MRTKFCLIILRFACWCLFLILIDVVGEINCGVFMENQEDRGLVGDHGDVAVNSLAQKVITANDVSVVRQNIHGRFAHASKKISIPVITRNEKGEEYCHQFPFDQVDNCFRPVESVSWDAAGEVLRGNTPNGTAMVGVIDRGMPFDYANSGTQYSGCIIPMSPDRKQKAKRSIRVFNNDDAVNYDIKVKTGHVLGQDVHVRTNSKKKRKPSQNRVMKCSAKDELKRFLNNNRSKLTAESINHLQKQTNPEWLHIIAHSLTNMNTNPQVRNNLGAARKQDNTRMMVIEKVPKRLSQYNDVSVDLQAQFSMFPNSQLVKDIAYEVVIHYGRVRLNVYQNIDVFSEYDYPRNTDQLISLVVEALLQGQAAHVSELVNLKQGGISGEDMDVDDESKCSEENVSRIANRQVLFQRRDDLGGENSNGEERGHDYNLRG